MLAFADLESVPGGDGEDGGGGTDYFEEEDTFFDVFGYADLGRKNLIYKGGGGREC